MSQFKKLKLQRSKIVPNNTENRNFTLQLKSNNRQFCVVCQIFADTTVK